MPILSARRLKVDGVLQSERSSAPYPEHYACEASEHHSERAIRRLELGLPVSRLLGLWIGPAIGEPAKFWLSVLSELKGRGAADVCCDGLTGLIESMNARLRKVTRSRGQFPGEQAALKVLYLAVRNLKEFRGGNAGIRSSGRKQALQAFTIY